MEDWEQKWIGLSMEDAKELVKSIMYEHLTDEGRANINDIDWKLAMVCIVSYIATHHEDFVKKLEEL